MRAIALALAIVGLLAGLWAARLWYRASRVQIIPMWVEQGRIEPVMPGQANTEWTIATIQSATKAGVLNAKAAFWTAVALVLSTAASVVSLI